jgi:ABC-2 type transport system ATP-binding protein
MSALRVAGVTKAFAGTRAVDDVDLEIGGGEVRGLLGPNGAGKTTLLRMLLGLVAPDAGSIELLGRPLHGAPVDALDGVAGFVEEPAFYPYLSGRANLELMVELDRRGARSAIDDALANVDLGRRAGERVSGYSTGMRQRLGIAAALLRSPRLLLLDEPTSGLDPAGARDVAALVRALAAQGVAVLLSSHQIGELESVCDSYTVLRHGRVVWDGTAAQLRAQAPASAYVVVTTDDLRAAEIATTRIRLRTGRGRDGSLAVAATEEGLDAFVAALAQSGVSIRRLDLLVSPLESMFFALTSDDVTPDLEPIELAERALATS